MVSPHDGAGVACPPETSSASHAASLKGAPGETEQAFGEKMSSSGLTDFKRKTLGCLSYLKPLCGSLFLENKVSY